MEREPLPRRFRRLGSSVARRDQVVTMTRQIPYAVNNPEKVFSGNQVTSVVGMEG
jgi:hypothetical protein